MAQRAPILFIRYLHIAAILLIASSIVSGYRAFDISWSGTGLIDRDSYYALHQASGVLLLVLLPIMMVVRIGLLVAGRADQDRASSLAWRFIVISGHMLILLTGTLLALSGWDGAMRGGISISFFGLVEWGPPFSATSPDESIRIYKFHKLLVVPFLALLSLHVIAALAHQFLVKDNLLHDMFSFRRGR